MKNLIIYSHPNSKSFTKALVDKVYSVLKAKNEEVEIIDLYTDKFNPVLDASDFATLMQGNTPEDVAVYQKMISNSDRLIILYPIWWMQMPAILKGFLDRVLLPGFAYKDLGENNIEPLLSGKKVTLITPMGMTEEMAIQMKAIEAFKITHADNTFGFCGMEIENFIFFYAVPFVSDEARKGFIKSLESYF